MIVTEVERLADDIFSIKNKDPEKFAVILDFLLANQTEPCYLHEMPDHSIQVEYATPVKAEGNISHIF